MANLTLRLVKGSPLTNAEVDGNFDNLNTSKLELSGGTLTGFLTLHSDPTQALHAASKQYVDEVAEGLKTKPAARAATTTNLATIYDNGTNGVGATLTADTNRAFGVLDGVVNWDITSPPMGVLVKNQTNPAHNGRYNLTSLGETGVSPWVLTRCSLCDEADEIPGTFTFVQFGNVNGGTGWVQTVADPDTFTVGTDAITVAQFSGAGTFTAGTGLTLTGNQFAMAADQLLPAQTGNNGRFLTTNGTATSWANVPAPNNGNLTLTVAGTGLSGSASFSADQAGNSTFTVSSNATSANTVGAIVARDGSGNFSAGTITAALSGNATTATTLQTARTIGGVSFNGSANINLPGVNTAGNQNTTGTAANVTGTVAIANGGTGGTTAQAARNNIAGAVTSGQYLRGNGTNVLMSAIQAADVPTLNQNTTGSAASLTTARAINGTNFNGTAAITTANWGTARTIWGQSINGSANITAPVRPAAGSVSAPAFSTSGDTNTGIYFSSADVLAVTTGGTQAATFAANGNFTAVGTVTANSDERIKTDWADLPQDFIERLTKVKCGTYTRTDNGERQAGSSAQDWQKLLPEVVHTQDDERGTLSLAYGNAALVAAIELSKIVVELKAEVQSLKAQLKG